MALHPKTMKKHSLNIIALPLLIGGVSQAATVVPGYEMGDGLFSYQVVDVIDSGTNPTIDNTTEARDVITTVGTALPGTVGDWAFSANDFGTIASVDNGGTDRLHTAAQLSLAPYDGTDIAIRYSGGIYFPAGDYSMFMNGDDGSSIVIPGVTFINRFGNVNGTPAADEILFEAPTGNSNTGAQFTIPAGGLVTTFEAVWFERGGGDHFEVELFSGFGTKTNADPFNADWNILSDGILGGVAVSSTPFVPVPEPSGSALLLIAGALLGIRRRR